MSNASDVSDLSEATKILLHNKIDCKDLFATLRYIGENNPYKSAEHLYKQIQKTKITLEKIK